MCEQLPSLLKPKGSSAFRSDTSQDGSSCRALMGRVWQFHDEEIEERRTHGTKSGDHSPARKRELGQVDPASFSTSFSCAEDNTSSPSDDELEFSTSWQEIRRSSNSFAHIGGNERRSSHSCIFAGKLPDLDVMHLDVLRRRASEPVQRTWTKQDFLMLQKWRADGKGAKTRACPMADAGPISSDTDMIGDNPGSHSPAAHGAGCQTMKQSSVLAEDSEEVTKFPHPVLPASACNRQRFVRATTQPPQSDPRVC